MAVSRGRIVWVRVQARCLRSSSLFVQADRGRSLRLFYWRCLWFAESWKCQCVVSFCRSSCKLWLQKTSEVWNWMNVWHCRKFTDVTCCSELCTVCSKLLNWSCLSEGQVIEMLMKEFLTFGPNRVYYLTICLIRNKKLLILLWFLCNGVPGEWRSLNSEEYRFVQSYSSWNFYQSNQIKDD